MLRRGEKPFGRAYITFKPALLVADQSPVVTMEVTARGRPEEETVPAALTLLNEERAIVVKTFAEATSPEMHKLWERTDA